MASREFARPGQPAPAPFQFTELNDHLQPDTTRGLGGAIMRANMEYHPGFDAQEAGLIKAGASAPRITVQDFARPARLPGHTP